MSPCILLGVSSLILKEALGCLAQFYTLDTQNQVRRIPAFLGVLIKQLQSNEQLWVVSNLLLPFLTEDFQQKKQQDGQTLLMSFCPINVSRDQILPFFPSSALNPCPGAWSLRAVHTPAVTILYRQGKKRLLCVSFTSLLLTTGKTATAEAISPRCCLFQLSTLDQLALSQRNHPWSPRAEPDL